MKIKRDDFKNFDLDHIQLDQMNGVALYQALIEHAPFPLGSMDFSGIIEYLDELSEKGVYDFRAYFTEHLEAVRTCFSKVQIQSANPQSLSLFGVSDLADFIANFAYLAGGDEALPAYIDFLVAFSERKSSCQSLCTFVTMTGQKIYCIVKWWTMPGSEANYSHVIVTVMDITRLKEQDIALRIKDHALASSTNAVVLADLKGFLFYANAAFYQMWGYDENDDISSKSFPDLCFDKQEEREIRETFFRDNGWYIGEVRALRKDRRCMDVQVSASLVRDENGQPICIFASFVDITRQKQAANLSIQREKQYHTLVECLPDAIFIFQDQVVVYVNSAGLSLLNARQPEEVYGISIQNIVSRDYVESANQRYVSVEQTRMRQPFRQIRFIGIDRKQVDVESSLIPFVYNNVPSVMVIARNISELKKDKKQLLEQKDQLRFLVHQLIHFEEQQRRKTASELHDRIAQDIILTKMAVDRLRQNAGVPHDSLRTISNDLNKILSQVQGMTFELGNPTLYMVGLQEALEDWLEDEVRAKHALSVSYSCSLGGVVLQDDMKSFLFRAIKELVINVIKHADAASVDIRIEQSKDGIMVRIQDDGRGISPASVGDRSRGGGFGLLNLKERVDYLGGRWTASSSCQGTTIEFMIPINHT